MTIRRTILGQRATEYAQALLEVLRTLRATRVLSFPQIFALYTGRILPKEIRLASLWAPPVPAWDPRDYRACETWLRGWVRRGLLTVVSPLSAPIAESGQKDQAAGKVGKDSVFALGEAAPEFLAALGYPTKKVVRLEMLFHDLTAAAEALTLYLQGWTLFAPTDFAELQARDAGRPAGYPDAWLKKDNKDLLLECLRLRPLSMQMESLVRKARALRERKMLVLVETPKDEEALLEGMRKLGLTRVYAGTHLAFRDSRGDGPFRSAAGDKIRPVSAWK